MAGSKIRLYGSTSGYVELEAPAVGDDGVLSLPTAADGFGAAGIGSNIVQTVKTDTFTTTSATFVTITGMSVTITPSSDTSKILVLVDLGCAGIANGVFNVRLRRGGSTVYAGATSGNQTLGLFAMMTYQNQGEGIHRYPAIFVDSPATAAAVTYELEVSRILSSAGTPTFLVNRGSADSNVVQHSRTASSITAIEVAA